MSASKRPLESASDLNNNEIISNSSVRTRKKLSMTTSNNIKTYTLGQIKELRMLNFMCHKNFMIEFHPTHMQIITGANGSGKSTIANALCLCLGAQARTTGRTSNVQSFIRNGERFAEISIVLANEGPEAYKPELYGKEIRITRKVGAKQSSYKIFGENGKVLSTRKETIDEINQALSISPENPLCVLHQEVAKTFLLHSNTQKKYQFYMKVSQLDQIKQAYESAVCTVQSIYQRINNMKNRHKDMLRALEPLEKEVKKVELRRDKEKKSHELEAELIVARSMEAQQELIQLQNELDGTQKSKDITEARINDAKNQIRNLDQEIERLSNDLTGLEKDLDGSNGLRALKQRFTKERKEVDLIIGRLSRECEQHHARLKEIQEEKTVLQKHIAEFDKLNRQSNTQEEQSQNFTKEIQNRQKQIEECDKKIISVINDVNASNDKIRTKQTSIDCIRNELKQKQNDLNELKKIEQDKTNVYGTWMSNCLKVIQSENRFHKKPIGPIGRYVRCIQPHWSYAVEKHLSSIMAAFVCTDSHDESILLDIFDKYCRGSRPTVYVTRFPETAPDVSGTLNQIRGANLLSIYQVLKIDNVVVESILIDSKQIEATILVDDLQHAKRIRQSGVLRWQKVYKKVKQVTEAWTYDGSNVKLDSAFRIYTNEKQPVKYFTSTNTQSLSMNELNEEIKRLNHEAEQMNSSMNELKTNREKMKENLEQMKNIILENQKKINELNRQLDRFNSTLPVVYDHSREELEEQLKECERHYDAIYKKFEEAKEKKEIEHQKFSNADTNLQNIEKKVETKIEEQTELKEKIHSKKLERQEIEQQLPKFENKMIYLKEDITKYQEKLAVLNKNKPKKLKTTIKTNRSVREIQQELDIINNFLKSNEDNIEERRQKFEELKKKREAAQEFKNIYERCYKQVQSLEKFVKKRKERFGQIADQHQYLLRHQFRNLMEKYHFDDCDIKVDHKKEDLEIIIKKNQRNIGSLSGGERSVSTFCFLMALWGSIYQPFRLLDEIDIYMDNEKRNLSLEYLYENTKYYSSSQHIILTPQAIDAAKWKQFNVPVFCMPTPKRSLQ